MQFYNIVAIILSLKRMSVPTALIVSVQQISCDSNMHWQRVFAIGSPVISL